ncbi:MAG: helix-turn-helix domain-containing protein [Bacteroidota bacterium]
MPLFNIYQLVLFLGVINGIIILISLSSLPRTFKNPSRFLGWFILGYTLYVANWTIFPKVAAHFNVSPLWLPSLFFLPALTYYFTQSITSSKTGLSISDKLFLVPGLIDTAYQLIKWGIALVSRKEYYFPLDDRNEFFIYEGIGIAFGSFCLITMYRHIKRSNLRQNQTYRFYRFAFYYLVFVLFRWIGLYFVDLFRPSLLFFELQFTFWAMDLGCFFFLGYRNLVAPRKYSVQIPATPVSNGQAEKLLDILDKDKAYLDIDFKRKDLADALETNEERISNLLNNELGVSFYELVNTYRAKEAKKLFDDGVADKLTMEAIARQAGFKSKATFYKFFKSQFGLKPRDYVLKRKSKR